MGSNNWADEPVGEGNKPLPRSFPKHPLNLLEAMKPSLNIDPLATRMEEIPALEDASSKILKYQ